MSRKIPNASAEFQIISFYRRVFTASGAVIFRNHSIIFRNQPVIFRNSPLFSAAQHLFPAPAGETFDVIRIGVQRGIYHFPLGTHLG